MLSAKPHVDELVVLDLGSVDDTAERARRVGARVESSVWSRDPSAVRNEALARSGADWNVVLEAREWIDGGGAGLRALAETPCDHVGLVTMIPGDHGRGLSPVALAPRLLPAGVRYAGRRPEEPMVEGLTQLRTGVVLASDDLEPARWRYDRSITETVLLQGLSLRPGDPEMLMDLGEVVRADGRLLAAYDAYAEALEGMDPAHPRRHEVVIEAIDVARAARRFPVAIALMDQHMAQWRDSPDFAYVIGDLFFEMLLADPRSANELAPLALSCWTRCLEMGDRPDLAGSLMGRGSFLAAQSLYALCLVLGQQAEASRWWDVANRLRSQASRSASLRSDQANQANDGSAN
nr:hypothetical protein [Kineosphaera limosa]